MQQKMVIFFVNLLYDFNVGCVLLRKGNKKGVVMIGDLNTVCEMAMMGRTVNDETLSGMVQAEILHVCMEDVRIIMTQPFANNG